MKYGAMKDDVMKDDVMKYGVMNHDVMKYDIMKQDVMTYDVMRYDIITYDVMTYDFMPYDVMTHSQSLFLHPIEADMYVKGELQCKATQKGVRKGQKISLSSLIVFLIYLPIKRFKPFSCTPCLWICTEEEKDCSQRWARSQAKCIWSELSPFL